MTRERGLESSMISQKNNAVSLSSQILDIELKLKAMTYLIENQRSEPILCNAENMDDVTSGFGRIFGEIASNLTDLRRELEEIELR